ncbi:MAG TPA: hypothetical protein PLX89_10875 [Verrucomicrobiota bacterium]|nr:hypothetical protein [Verrucomicrobiota bacterium]
MRYSFGLVAAILVGLAGVRADILELKDGSVLNGTFLGSTAQVMRFQVGSLELEFPTTDVLALTMSGAATPAPPPPPPPPTPAPAQPAPAPVVPRNITIPAGTSLLVRMSDTVSTRNSAGRRFGARLDADLRVDGVVVAPSGTRLYGRVEESRQAGRMTGSSHLEIGLNEIKINGTRFSIVTSDFRVRAGNSTANTAINTGVGAGIGAAFGGGRGAGRGAAVGAGASALSSGDHATIASGELIEFRLLEPLTVPR